MSVSYDVTLGLCLQDLRAARRKTKLMQGTVEGEGVWRITAVQGFSCYQCLCVHPQGNRGGKAVVSAPRGPAAYGTNKIEAILVGKHDSYPKSQLVGS